MGNELGWGSALKVLGISIVGAGVAFAGASSLGFGDQDLSDYAKKADVELAKNATLSALGATDSKVISLQDVLLKEDAWESAAEVLALSEVEDRDYRDLGRFVLNDTNASSDDVKDADLSVTVKDTNFASMDEDDQDGVVTFELSVRYEDATGDRKKQTVTATATIEDGEVEDLTFAQLEFFIF